MSQRYGSGGRQRQSSGNGHLSGSPYGHGGQQRDMHGDHHLHRDNSHTQQRSQHPQNYQNYPSEQQYLQNR